MFLTAASFDAPRQCEPTRVKPKVTPTSISAIGLKALANKSSGISIIGGSILILIGLLEVTGLWDTFTIFLRNSFSGFNAVL